ncbi:MAG: hypothetical protein GX759_00480 [Thermoanaerobacterales bacterium]|jgi:hypothetical protein|nr:hypothetical protein [Thermoanaerobacterales bacterium]
MGDIDIYSQISNMKDVDYKNTLALVSLIEILIDKGVIDRHELAQKAREIDNCEQPMKTPGNCGGFSPPNYRSCPGTHA